MIDVLKYEGEKVVVTGVASGMGEETARLLSKLGAEVYGLDINKPEIEIDHFIPVNLNDKSSIDDAVEKLPEKISSIFNCAGVAGSTYANKSFSRLDVITINFIGPRHLIESLVPKMKKEGAIAILSSINGLGWTANKERLLPLLNTSSFDEAQEWYKENEKTFMEPYDETPIPEYTVSKELVTSWVKKRAYELSEQIYD
ncbi:SDR family NAD(P)-dependent oxidoreductase [Oceanobacillus sp. 143]|nr:SDR family NAD(P)-dependent oxidoreductase [Oceanobacillus sp. 143]